jgi:hypothetical protein
VTQAGPEAVTVDVLDDPGLVVYYLEGALGAVGYAQTAAVTEPLIYLDNVSYNHSLS